MKAGVGRPAFLKGRIVQPSPMNALERDYGQALALQQHAGQIVAWRYQPFKLRLATGAYYTPDFLVVANSGLLELHETKGWMREAAQVRLKLVAELYWWFPIYLVTRQGKTDRFAVVLLNP